MKIVGSVLLCVLLARACPGQNELTPARWREDIRFLRETVHRDYSFLFKKVTREAFDAEADKLEQAVPELQQHEIVAGIRRLVALFGYGHSQLVPGHGAARFHALNINPVHFPDGIFIQAAHKDHAELIGARILEVEGRPVDSVLEALRPLVPVENEQFFLNDAPGYLRIPEALHAQKVISPFKTDIRLKIEKDGAVSDVNFSAVPAGRIPLRYGLIPANSDWIDAREGAEPPLWLRNPERHYEYVYLPEFKTVYVRQSQIADIPDQPIPEFYQQLFEWIENNDVDRLVLDVRLNGGGNNQKLKPIVTGILGCRKVNQPGKLFVLIGRRTYSACQNLVNELDHYTPAIFVGEPTGENINFYGDSRPVILPNSKLDVRLSFAWWQDKAQWENAPWTAPDIAVPLTFDDYCKGRDPVLSAALEFNPGEFNESPVEYLMELYNQGKMELLQSEAMRISRDPRHDRAQLEARINTAGYDSLAKKDFTRAEFLFQMNCDLFPQSANTWDSLAEYHWRMGDTQTAIRLYQKAISANPDSETARNARRMIQRVEKGERPDESQAVFLEK
jgi:tetratricopeptide (TPR) repeat protein